MKPVDVIAQALGIKTTSECIAERICAFCHVRVTGFRDLLSEREYQISGLCQTHQDEVFDV